MYCRYCGAPIEKSNAKQCPECKRVPFSKENSSEPIFCISCGTFVGVGAVKCPNCDENPHEVPELMTTAQKMNYDAMKTGKLIHA